MPNSAQPPTVSKTPVFTGFLGRLVLPDRSVGVRLALALAIASIALAFRLLLSPAFADRIPWVTSFPAVLLAALVGGWLAAVVTLVACGLVGFVLVQPILSSMVAFWLNGALVAWTGVELRRALRSARVLAQRSERAEGLLAGSEDLRHLISAIRDYEITMLDADGCVLTWNPGAEAIKGYSSQEIIGKHIEVFYTAEDRAAGVPRALLERARSEGRAEHLGWHVRKSATQFWADVTITAMRNSDGELTGFAKVVRDLTERRNLEQERLRAARAEEAVRLRDEFLSIAAHELKTPLAALHLQLETLQSQLASVDQQIGKRFARAARSSARMADLVRSLLDVSRITAGRLELSRERFALRDAIVDVVDRFRDAAAAVDCDLRVACDEGVEGTWDKLRIEQVVTNLVANAIKYAPGAPIDVTVKADGDDALLEVSDGGPGIDEAALPRIFQRFERAKSAPHHAGLGLGLFVTREIVEAHGGSVVAHNLDNGGARFSVRLPLARVIGRGVQPAAGGLH